MQFFDQGHPIIGEPGHEDELPQGTGSIKGLRKQVTTELEQLRFVPRSGEPALSNVVNDVERLVVLPGRRSLMPQPGMRLLAEPGHELQPERDQLSEVVEAKRSDLVQQRASLEDADGRQVHRRPLVLKMQKGRIEAGE